MVNLEMPDEGWAWVIAGAGCMINMLLSGLSRMIGILYVYVFQQYNVTRQEASFPFAVRNSIRMCSGPLVGIVGQSFGIRTVTFCGGVIAALGAALCCIAPNITWLTVFWGGMHGVGFAFANTLFQVVVNQYFEKYRATASGIALSGACVGSLGFPILIETVLDTYGLSGGFLILGGVILNVLPPALMLKSPSWVENPEKYARLLARKKAEEAAKLKESVETIDTDVTIILEQHEIENVCNQKRLARQRSLSNNPAEELVYPINSNHLEDTKGIFSHLRGNESFPNSEEEQRVVCTRYKMKQCHVSPTLEEEEEVENNGQLHTISEQVAEKNGDIPPSSESQTKTKGNRTSVLDTIKMMGRVYSNPVYILISVCMSTYIVIFIPILTVLVDYAIDKGIDESYGKYLINGLALGDLVGRLGFGWVTDRGIMTIPAFMCAMLVLQGVFIALFPMAMSLYAFMATLVLYGAAAGSMLVLFPVLVLKYVDIHSQSVALANVGFLSGLVSFCVPPMIGYFRDYVGSYDGMFYLVGGVSVMSGGMWLMEPVVVKYYYGESFQDELNNKNLFQNIEKRTKEESKPR
ncbi:monocarboxylate transporter 5-like [Parasteatoda tepidariorum]|uniref:monocarboxylate transporter 5-like n=1 Tax=Parasteatoda tepidariorum TaxID=114398 RepID=UPI0039BD12C6